MSERPIADVVAELRGARGFIKTGPHATFLREAADLIEHLDADLAALVEQLDERVCPFCGGTRWACQECAT